MKKKEIETNPFKLFDMARQKRLKQGIYADKKKVSEEKENKDKN